MGFGNDGDEFFDEKSRVINRFVRIFTEFRNGCLVEIVVADIIEERAGMAVGRADHDAGNGNAGFLAGLRASVGCDVERDAHKVAKDHGDSFIALTKYESFGFKGIVDAGGKPFVEVTGHAHSSRWS